MKLQSKLEARHLRQQGLAINAIAKQLKVAKSSVSIWVRDIELTEAQKLALLEQNPAYNREAKGAKIRKEQAELIRLEYQNKGKETARTNNPLHLAGCMLYWAEGSKSRTSLKFVNSDSNMMLLFIRFLRECFDLSNDSLTIRVAAYTNNGLSMTDIESYWLNILQLPQSCLRKGQENNLPKSSKATKKNKLLYGTCTVCVNSTAVIQHIYGAIQAYASFDCNYGLNFN